MNEFSSIYFSDRIFKFNDNQDDNEMSKTKIEEIRERTEKNASMRSDDFGHSVQDLLEFESQALQIAADDITYLLQEIDRLNGKLEFAKKSLRFYSRKEYDRVCFLDHAICAEHYGADARETLKALESE